MSSVSSCPRLLVSSCPRLKGWVLTEVVQQKLSLSGFNPAQRVVGSLFLPVSFMLKRRPTSHNALLLSGHRRHSTRLRGGGGGLLTSASRPSLTLLLVFSSASLIRPVRTRGELSVGRSEASSSARSSFGRVGERAEPIRAGVVRHFIATLRD